MRCGAAVLLSLVACSPEPAPPPALDPPLQEVVLTLGGASRVELSGAWIDTSGDGRGVEAVATVSDEPPLEVRADRTEWALSDGKISFSGGVVATRGALQLTAQRLQIDLVDGQARRGVATGQVRITQPPREARSGRAVLDFRDEKLTLTEGPWLREGEQRMRGHRIVILIHEDRVICEDCRVRVEPPTPSDAP